MPSAFVPFALCWPLRRRFLTWGSQDLEPPRSAAPRAGIHFARLAGISGRVFNSYDFGGYLIFSGIPTFVDGRAELYGDAFLRKYFEAVGLVDIRDAFRLLDEYKIDWIILKPAVPLARALQESNGWNNVYSDDTSNDICASSMIGLNVLQARIKRGNDISWRSARANVFWRSAPRHLENVLSENETEGASGSRRRGGKAAGTRKSA